MAIIDWDQFNENFQYYDKEIISEVIYIFVNEYNNRISGLQKNIDEKNYTSLAFNAHSFKSVIGNYMAPKAYELTRKLEELAKNNSEEEINEIFPELKSATRELLFELKNYLQDLEK
ncbi:MAG: Hpt domain-containing protein [Bacteroidia bacterium]|nr:Hpt domain-containing protein [Bacteroidia bacterium]